MLKLMSQSKSKTNTSKHFASVGLFIIILVMSISILAVMFLRKPISELSLDTRKAAMVDSGLVELDTYPFDQSTLKVNEEQKINLQVNTKDKAVDSIKLVFEVIADKGLLDKSKIKFTGIVPEEFEVSKQEIIQSICDRDCYTVTLLLSLKDPAITFTTHNQIKTISELNFTPLKEGSLKLKISQDSTAIEHETLADILQKPSVLDFQYYVTSNGIDRAQCYFAYGSWGTCQNGWQTRQYSVQPDNCQWYTDETLKELSQKCVDNNVVSINSNYFYMYSNDKCLNQPSQGESLYVIWNASKYKNVTWIDVSSSPTFSDFYHKKVDGNIDQTNGDWLIVNAKGFSHATGNKAPLSFEPNKEYFFRLYSTNNGGQHISSVRYYITYCSGDQSAYKNCNDTCDINSDQSKSCAPGMTCYEGACRNKSNPTNNLCLATPGIHTNDRTCNQYCANNNDCASGLTCFWNRCRASQNLDNSSCEIKVKTVNYSTAVNSNKTILLPSQAYDLSANDCNQGCNNNRDCGADMRCYKGKCRLADDPESISCSTITTDSANTGDRDQNASNSASKGSGTGSNTNKADSVSTTTEKSSSFFQSSFGKLLSNFSWQWLAFAGAILLIAISLIVASIANAKQDPWQKKDREIEIPKNEPPKF